METITDTSWSSKQREGHSLHESPYLGCFQPQLADYFIQTYSQPGQVVLDPCAGRGTTPFQARLRERHGLGLDVNPTAIALMQAKAEINQSAYNVDWGYVVTHAIHTWAPDAEWLQQATDIGLFHFFHEKNLLELACLRTYYRNNPRDQRARFVGLLVLCTMTGHSAGYLSTRTMPPNQQLRPDRQQRLNEKAPRNITYKDTAALLSKKAKRLLRDPLPELLGPMGVYDMNLEKYATSNWKNRVLRADLVLFSPPFLNVIDYDEINWMRNFWLTGKSTNTMSHRADKISDLGMWSRWLHLQLVHIRNVCNRGARVCIEVGPVRNRKVNLMREVKYQAIKSGWTADRLYIHSDQHSRTSRCWGVESDQGTNCQQVIVLHYD